jgi:O-phosphoseryl-tRNA synthetase
LTKGWRRLKVKWNSREIVKKARKDFEAAWSETAKLVPRRRSKPLSPAQGKPHVIFDTIQQLRKAYLSLGFEEVVNPVFIEDKEVRRQFGPEGYAILDRCYYLGGLPRPDIGLSGEKLRQLEELGISVGDSELLQEVLHRYKKGEFGGDDLIYKLAKVLKISDSLAVKVLDRVFPEFRALTPEASRLTLRSHMTGGWFLTLKELVARKPFPIRLFSIDRCFRREQQEDAFHLRSHHSASCVLVDEEACVEDGKEVSRRLLEQFGFKDFKFKLDEKRSKYYAPGTQTEVYGYRPKLGWVELATFGIYSPVALSKYRIEYPVMNLGLGVERLAMVLHGYSDLRELVYPQFYAEWRMSDRELASLLRIDKTPTTKEGMMIARAILEHGRKHADNEGPCEVRVYSGSLLGAEVEVKLVEREKGKKLLGPAALNEVYVYGACFYGLGAEADDGIKSKGISTGISYLQGIANLAAYEIEEGVRQAKKKITVKVKTVKSFGDINLALNRVAHRYVTTYSKTIDVRGPVFVTIEASVTLK